MRLSIARMASISGGILAYQSLKRYWNTDDSFSYLEHANENRESSLYPLRKPYREGYLKVSPIHTIYYHLYGKPDGKAVLVIHGGPGGSSKPGTFCTIDL